MEKEVQQADQYKMIRLYTILGSISAVVERSEVRRVIIIGNKAFSNRKKEMSGEESPFFRKYSPGTPLVSPFFAEGGVQPTRFQKSAVDSPIAKSPAKKGKYRQSLPLVYTEFRSPEAAILHKRDPRPSGAQENDQLQDPVHNNSVATSQEVVTRHSFVAAVENMGSNSVWLVLLLPTITSLIFYCLTMDWRYVTFVTPIEYSTILQVPYRLPVADYQLSFLRSLVIVDKYQCPQSTCEEYQMTISADLHTKSTSASSEPGPENLLYTSFPLASYILEYYALMNNESGHYNYSVLIPLPMLHSDTPLFSRSPTRYATILARFGKEGEQSAVVEPAPSSLAGNANNEIVEESKGQYRSSGTAGQSLGAAWRWAAVPTTAESKSKFAGSVSITTFSEAYILFVAILQLFLSAGTLTCLVHMVRATYSSARKLQEKFSFVRTELKVECEDTGYGYGSVEKSEIAETANPEVRVWQFILPEQYTAIALLAFLCAWQGGLPACCVLLSAAGCTINTTTLFICGLIVSLAQFGLLFSLVLYINGLKFHSSAHSAPQSSSYGTTLDSSANNKRLSSARNSYEPFAVQHESHSPDTKSNTEEIDYWRRGSLGLQGAMYGKYARPAHELTPLEREHRRALSLFVTHHHPCSIEFLGFAYRKLVLLFLTWVVVVLYWLLMYPRLWHSKELSDMQVQNVQFRFRVLDVLVLLLSAAWGYYLAQVRGSRLVVFLGHR